MNSFYEHYYNEKIDDEEQIDEVIVPAAALIGAGAVGGVSLIWKVLNSSVNVIFKSLKPKKIKLNNLNNIDPNKINQVPNTLFSYMHKLLAADLMLWRRKSKDKSFMNKFVMKRKDVYVTDLYQVIVNEDLKDEFGEMFDLTKISVKKPGDDDSDYGYRYLINEFSTYKISNGGFVSVVSIADPYLGPPKDKKVSTIGKKLKNLKYYIFINDKAQKWFDSKTGMLFKQFLVTRENITKSEMKSDVEDMANTYGLDIPQEEPEKEVEPKTQEKPEPEKKEEPKTQEEPPTHDESKIRTFNVPDSDEKIKYSNKQEISRNQYDQMGFSGKPENLKIALKDILGDSPEERKKNIRKWDNVGRKIDFKNYKIGDGNVALLKNLKNDKYFVLFDDRGRLILQDKPIYKHLFNSEENNEE